MAGLLGWVKDATVRLLDPQRDQRINEWAGEVERRIATDRKMFDYSKTLHSLGVLSEDVKPLSTKVLERFLHRAWRDKSITTGERATLDWIAKALGIAPDNVVAIEGSLARRLFEDALNDAIADGVLDPTEIETLTTIATSQGQTVRSLVLGYFRTTGESFLRNLFIRATQDGRISDKEWGHLLNTATALGLERNEFLQTVYPQAEQFVEHTLADAKADGELTEQEHQTLDWLLQTLALTNEFRSYAHNEIRRLELLMRIKHGMLPSLTTAQLSLRAGELLHFEGAAEYSRVRMLKSGPQIDSYHGQVAVTDSRFLFTSPERSCEINHRRVIQLDSKPSGVDIRTSGKGAGLYLFQDPELAIPIYTTAVGKANQTIVPSGDALPSRHIPREVRQRVWQNYLGRCAECSATDYLEFDHIIPVARGGSNAETNVQLLCRRCNLKKSDHI